MIGYIIVDPAFRKETDTEELDGFCRTLSIFVEYIESNHLLSGNQRTLGQLIKQYIRKNLGNKIPLKSMSQNLHCSTVTLTESFRKEYNMTIMRYVLEQRMKMAEQLLLSNAVTVTKIAERSGFPDVEYFSKCFKETHGMPPSAWRRSMVSKKSDS